MPISIAAKILFVQRYLEKHKLSRNELGRRTQIHQSQISRILNGQCVRNRGHVDTLYRYALEHSGGKGADPSASDELMAALRYAWDGTDSGAHYLARIIRAVGQGRRLDSKPA